MNVKSKIVEKMKGLIKKRERKEIVFELNKKILIVSPHQDDETLGCGALINKYSSIVDILLVTNGELGNPELTKAETVAIRNKEFDLATKGVHKTFKMGLRDSNFSFGELKKKKFNFKQYDAIFVPGKKELHPDHVKVNKYVKKLACKKRIYEYEVWKPLDAYNCFLDFSDDATKKWERIEKYKCQLRHINYLDKIKGLNCYRGIGLNAEYVECYKETLFWYEKIFSIIIHWLVVVNEWRKKIV